MRTLWFGLQWAGRQFAFLATLVTAALLILLLPSSVSMYLNRPAYELAQTLFRADMSKYWAAVRTHLGHLLQGQLIPPLESLPLNSPLRFLPKTLSTALPVTLQLLGTALVASLLLGLAIGVLLSGLTPRRVRAPLWGATTLLSSIPDLLIATFLSLSVVIVALIRGTGPLYGSDAWQHFWAPCLALTLVVMPYIARVTATAIDEITGQIYIRAAVAKGVHPLLILVKHVGKNVLVRLSSILPVVVSLLFSSGAVIEYMMEVQGVGRALIMSIAPKVTDRYLGVAYLIPMLLFFTLALGLSGLVQRWLDPRIGPVEAAPGPVRLPRFERAVLEDLRRWPLGLGRWLRAIPFALWRGLSSLPGALWRGLLALPVHLRRWLRDPWVLTGGLLVLGLVAVAVAAPWLVPFDPAKRINLINYGTTIGIPPFPPGPDHLLGTDDLGRDLFSQILVGTRYALYFALLAVPARFLLAVPVGLLAAFRGGLWERLIRWLTTFFTAVPQVVLPLALIPSINLIFRLQPSLMLLFGVLLVALPGAPRLAESVRQQAVEVLVQPFVEGAQAVGAGTFRTLFRYVLPQMLPQLVTMLTLEIPAVLTLTALLSYFQAYPGGTIYDTQGFKPVAPVIPEWGSLMVNPLILLMAGHWWQWAPYVALFIAVLAFNLLGEGMRRVLASRTGWRWQR